MELRKANLESRRARLKKLLTEEAEQHREEMRRLSASGAARLGSGQKEGALSVEGLRAKREALAEARRAEQRKEAEEKMLQHWKLNNPDFRQVWMAFYNHCPSNVETEALVTDPAKEASGNGAEVVGRAARRAGCGEGTAEGGGCQGGEGGGHGCRREGARDCGGRGKEEVSFDGKSEDFLITFTEIIAILQAKRHGVEEDIARADRGREGEGEI